MTPSDGFQCPAINGDRLQSSVVPMDGLEGLVGRCGCRRIFADFGKAAINGQRWAILCPSVQVLIFSYGERTDTISFYDSGRPPGFRFIWATRFLFCEDTCQLFCFPRSSFRRVRPVTSSANQSPSVSAGTSARAFLGPKPDFSPSLGNFSLAESSLVRFNNRRTCFVLRKTGGQAGFCIPGTFFRPCGPGGSFRKITLTFPNPRMIHHRQGRLALLFVSPPQIRHQMRCTVRFQGDDRPYPVRFVGQKGFFLTADGLLGRGLPLGASSGFRLCARPRVVSPEMPYFDDLKVVFFQNGTLERLRIARFETRFSWAGLQVHPARRKPASRPLSGSGLGTGTPSSKTAPGSSMLR